VRSGEKRRGGGNTERRQGGSGVREEEGHFETERLCSGIFRPPTDAVVSKARKIL